MAAIREALAERNVVIVRQLYFHNTLAAVGVEAENMMSFETFHPRYGKIVYANDPDAFIEVPLRIHVREREGVVTVRYRKPSALFASYSGLTDLGVELDQLFEVVVDRVVR